jgi:HD-like signal output (HDOD) protein
MNLASMITNLKNLPPAPRVMPKLLKLLNNDDASVVDIVGLIQLDASLTAKLISMANSAYFAAGGSIADLDEAVNRLGFREIYRTVSLICSRSLVGQSLESYQLDADERWYHSVIMGIVMETLALRLQTMDTSTAYTIGLLHDIGKIAIHQSLGASYAEVLRQVEQKGIPLVEGERQSFGFDHAAAGSMLLATWDFPSEIHEPIGCQYEPSRACEYPQHAALLHFSQWIAASIGGVPGKNAWAFALDEGVFSTLKVNQSQAMALMLSCKAQVDQKQSLFE